MMVVFCGYMSEDGNGILSKIMPECIEQRLMQAFAEEAGIEFSEGEAEPP